MSAYLDLIQATIELYGHAAYETPHRLVISRDVYNAILDSEEVGPASRWRGAAERREEPLVVRGLLTAVDATLPAFEVRVEKIDKENRHVA